MKPNDDEMVQAFISESRIILRRYCRLGSEKIYLDDETILALESRALEENGMQESPRPERHLWILLFLKLYSSEEVLCVMAETSKKTNCKWVWYIIL